MPNQTHREIVNDLVDSIAAELRNRLNDGECGATLREWLLDHLHETIDGSQHVIYTARAREVLERSSNAHAYADNFGDPEEATVNQLAYAALYQDVIDRMFERDINPNAPDDDATRNAVGASGTTCRELTPDADIVEGEA